MLPVLPDDILHLICAELSGRRDFDTLFNCSVACKNLAVPALTHLYRFHHDAPLKDMEPLAIAQQELIVQKWSIMWRSIILSSLPGEKTMYPYSRYLRVLDMRDLKYLLEEDKFRSKISRTFFAGDLARFRIVDNTTPKSGRKAFLKLNYSAIIEAVGDVITEHTPMLEQLSGDIPGSALIRWAPRLPRLRSLELGDSRALGEEGVRAVLPAHCPHFDSVSLYFWIESDSDHKLATFLSSLRQQSLRSFTVISEVGMRAETFLALNSHSAALRELKLFFADAAIPHLSLLKACTSIDTLELNASSNIDLERTQNDVFLETIEWLRDCKNLRSLSMSGLLSGAAIVTPLLSDPEIRLQKLKVDAYMMKDHRHFHLGLANQKDLQGLFLVGESEDVVRDDVDALVESLQKLTDLRDLELRGVSDYFNDEHIIAIVSRLMKLEDLYITGLGITDAVLNKVGELRNLRRVTFNASTTFTADGLLEFISKLGQGNEGIEVSVDMANPEDHLTEEEQGIVRETLWKKVGGSFEYTLIRDPDISEFEGESD